MKQKRQKLLSQLIQQNELHSQREVLELLRAQGVDTNQATVSRDFSELGINKIDGVYRLPVTAVLSARKVLPWVSRLQIQPAGDHMLVVKTGAGQASLLGLQIDEARFPGVLGTVAGDDTLFVAVDGRGSQAYIIEQIEQLVPLQARKVG